MNETAFPSATASHYLLRQGLLGGFVAYTVSNELIMFMGKAERICFMMD